MKIEKKKIFVICPIGDEGTPTRENSDTIFNVIDSVVKKNNEFCNCAVVRADKIENTGLITLQIYRELKTSDVCVVDLTGINPNVLYEFGIRQALLKPYVLIAKKGTTRPFDIQNFRIIFYDNSESNWTYKLENNLVTPLRNAINGEINEYDEMIFRNKDDNLATSETKHKTSWDIDRIREIASTPISAKFNSKGNVDRIREIVNTPIPTKINNNDSKEVIRGIW